MKKILLVHDHQESPAIRQSVLETVGYQVTLCSHGAEGLRILEEEMHDAVVMDILVEGKNGFEVCRDIRRRHGAEDLPVILCSGVYRKGCYFEEAKKAGAQHYMLRPLDLSEMVNRLGELISKKDDGDTPQPAEQDQKEPART